MKFRILLTLAAVALGSCSTTTPNALTDPQIAMVMRVMNLSEVREGELARQNGADAAVREFAAAMVTEHSAQSARAEEALAQANVASEDTPLSHDLDAASGAATDRLRPLSGRELDRAYIDREVQSHQKYLSVIDSTLMPRVHHKIVREQLNQLRSIEEKHLERAKQIEATLAR